MGLNYDYVVMDAESSPTTVPPWVYNLGVAAWIRDSEGNISFMNRRAEELLGMQAADSVGQPCYCVVRGRSDSGEAVCGPDCHISVQARQGLPLETADMRIPWPDSSGHHIRVITICIDNPDGESTSLLHCAFSIEREHRSMEYLRRLVSRDTDTVAHRLEDCGGLLTSREQEILELLVADYTLHAIASELHVSYATVRNHVQHILAKLRVHSIIEAVAVYLLTSK